MKNWHLVLTIGWRVEWEGKIGDHVAEKIKQAREEEGVSQRQLSTLLSRSNAYVSQIESRRLSPTIFDLVGLVFALKRPIKYFLPVDEPMEEELSGEEWTLLNQFRKIKDDGIRETAIRQIAELVKLEKKGKDK